MEVEERERRDINREAYEIEKFKREFGRSLIGSDGSCQMCNFPKK